jgi:hypothetical protein
MRTKKETEAEARRRAMQAMVAAGWNGVPTQTALQVRYWEDWDESLEEASTDLENENENH